MTAELACPKCAAPLDFPDPGTPTSVVCGGCNSPIEAYVFPALADSAPRGVGPERRLDDSEGGCFFHAHNKAHLPCDFCGRFLCTLCDLEVQGRHFCPSCLESGRHRQHLEMLVQRRFVPDRAALVLALVPLLFYPVLLITAPLGLYFVFRSFGPARSLVPAGRKARATFAAVLFALQILGSVIGVLAMFR